MKEGKRIKELRNALNLNQTNFGEQLGLKQTTIAGYENNHRELTDRTISDICRVFNVNEEWLRTGDGPMFRPKKGLDNELAEHIADLIKTDDELTKAFILELLKLSPEEMEVIKKILLNVSDYMKK
ncbi:helix-turn-helix domain-containing protein [Anaerotignum sp. MSJ-24]|uniref:helix-turn-helix domain-containing protein n=1 Tax=Anaerotignum sp. MSJ-24 TaxID=2841521 RepID=UPI001C1042A0|nr:helix-turn-helix transcriptional regulator [Anaerotignum sp. MSJ-24]MBU5464946.1 helix-turn-helix domain-containing protein [Anaerotignum sp. MSJ-24]